KTQAEWFKFLEASRDDPGTRAPTKYDVANLQELLTRAEKGTPYMLGQPLQLSSHQREDILKLCGHRHDVEHAKPQEWLIEVSGLPRIGANVAVAQLGQSLRSAF